MMEISNWLAIGFALVIVLPVLFMIFTSNIIRAAFAFAFTLLGMAGLYVILSAELMAVVQIMIYVGGVVVLLIFGIMLTVRLRNESVATGHREVVLGAGLSLLLFAMFVHWIRESGLKWGSPTEKVDQVEEIGISFLTTHILSFEIVAFLLLVTLVGAAFLAKKSNIF